MNPITFLYGFKLLACNMTYLFNNSIIYGDIIQYLFITNSFYCTFLCSNGYYFVIYYSQKIIGIESKALDCKMADIITRCIL